VDEKGPVVDPEVVTARDPILHSLPAELPDSRNARQRLQVADMPANVRRRDAEFAGGSPVETDYLPIASHRDEGDIDRIKYIGRFRVQSGAFKSTFVAIVVGRFRHEAVSFESW
jgi:hypothetical protein